MLGRIFHSTEALRRHALAAFSAFAAGVGALLHHWIVAEGATVRLALAADLGARAADGPVYVGIAAHGSGGGFADRGAVDHERDVLGFRVLTSFLEAVRKCRIAASCAVVAVVDAAIDFGIGAVTGGVRHEVRPKVRSQHGPGRMLYAT